MVVCHSGISDCCLSGFVGVMRFEIWMFRF